MGSSEGRLGFGTGQPAARSRQGRAPLLSVCVASFQQQYHARKLGDRAVAQVVRAPDVEATDPAFECHSAQDFPTGAEACVYVRVV